MDNVETEETRSLERRKDELAHLMLQHDGEKSLDEIRTDVMAEELREIDRRLEALRQSALQHAEESRRGDEEDLLRQERIR